MILVNRLEKEDKISGKSYSIFLRLLAPFAPHLAEELWKILGMSPSVHISSWPVFDASKLQEEKVKIAVQINGKIRAVFETNRGNSEDYIKKIALDLPDVIRWMNDKIPRKIIYVKDKLISIALGT